MSGLFENVAPILNAFRSVPFWVLIGFAISALTLLVAPSPKGIDLAAFKAAYGHWIWTAFVASTCLAMARLLDGLARFIADTRERTRSSKGLTILLIERESWWHAAKQQDETMMSQISVTAQIVNNHDKPLRILNVSLLKPSGHEISHADASIPVPGTYYHSSQQAIPAGDAAKATIHLMVRGLISKQGTIAKIVLAIADQRAHTYKVKCRLRTSDKPSERKRNGLPFRRRVVAELPLPTPSIWSRAKDFDELNVILREEQRAYAAKGRRSGHLGSLNVTLQSEPNHGWSRDGQIPELLWEADKAVVISSPNLDKMLRLLQKADEASRADMESYLLSHLCRPSEFADVAYFIFLALHRQHRTCDALEEAQKFLAGDRKFGYSNLLGTLSALVSHEHASFDHETLITLSRLLKEDKEHNFRLLEKLNAARMRRLG
jgi:hypothetical protein